VNFIHEDIETTVHNLVDFLGIELLRDGGIVGHVGEEDCNQLALALDGAARVDDLIGEELGRVGLWLRIVDLKGCFYRLQVIGAVIAEFGGRLNLRPTFRAFYG
jgi:hypothetical protein